MEYAALVLRLVLAGVFVTSATAKVLDYRSAKKAMNDFGVPVFACGFAASFLIVLEYCVAFLFIPVETSRIAAIASAGLLVVFTAAMLRLLLKGKSADCRCFGQLQSRPVDTGSIVRNIVLITIAAGVLLIPETGPDFAAIGSGENQNFVLAVLGFAVWCMLTASVILGLESRNRNDVIEERLEKLEATAAFLDKREAAGDPQEGMPVGSFPREVTLSDVDSNPTALSELWSEDKPLLAILASPSCVPCEALAANFAAWATELSDKINLAIITSGDIEENIAKFGSENRSRLFFQNDDEVAKALGSKWTPTAVLIGTDGRIASRPAAGDTAIEKLVLYVRETDFDANKPLFVGAHDDMPSKRFGDEVPEFELSTITGSPFTKNDLLGKNTLAVFWSLTCPHCTDMLDQLLSWRNNGSNLALAIFAEGDETKLRETGLEETLILDDGYKVSEEMGMHGTPSAVLIDPSGRIISELVAGVDRIRMLSGFE